MPHSVLVVEDDTDTREYVAEALRGGGSAFRVDSAGSLAEADAKLRDEPPDIILVDLGLPDGSGLDLIRRARAIPTEVRCLVISVFGDEASVIGAIEAGAQGYLLKSEAPGDLRESIHQVLEGGAPISPGIAGHLLRRFRSDDAQPNPDQPHLTPREREILELLVKGLSLLAVGKVLGLTRNTVAFYVKNIYSKLEVSSRGEAVYEALTQGIVSLDRKG